LIQKPIQSSALIIATALLSVIFTMSHCLAADYDRVTRQKCYSKRNFKEIQDVCVVAIEKQRPIKKCKTYGPSNIKQCHWVNGIIRDTASSMYKTRPNPYVSRAYRGEW